MFLPILNRNRSNCEIFWVKREKFTSYQYFATWPTMYISQFLLCGCSFKHSKGSCCCHFIYQTWFLHWYLVFLETERICTVMLVCRKWYDVIHGSTVSKKIDLRLEKYFWASAIIHQRMHVISLHTLPMRSANIILTWLSAPGAAAWTTDLLTGHYACLNRLIAWGTFVSAEDLWSHNLWKAHSLGAELHRGSVSRAVEVIFWV